MFLQFLFRVVADTVDTLQHLIVGIALPVSARELDQLEMLEQFCVFDMRTAAEIGKVSLCVAGDNGLVLVHTLDQIDLIGIVFETFESFRFGEFVADDILSGLGAFLHFLFDRSQIIFGDDFIAEIDIIVETVFDDRSDPEFRTRIQMGNSLCQQVSTTMVQRVEMFIFFDVDHFSNLLQ